MIALADAIDADALRLRSEFLEMPMLILTVAQTARLCDLSRAHAQRLLDALIDQATKTPDFDKRTALYQQAETILTGANGDLPIMPIYWYTLTETIHKNKVKGFLTSPTGQYDLTKVTVTS